MFGNGSRRVDDHLNSNLVRVNAIKLYIANVIIESNKTVMVSACCLHLFCCMCECAKQLWRCFKILNPI